MPDRFVLKIFKRASLLPPSFSTLSYNISSTTRLSCSVFSSVLRTRPKMVVPEVFFHSFWDFREDSLTVDTSFMRPISLLYARSPCSVAVLSRPGDSTFFVSSPSSLPFALAAIPAFYHHSFSFFSSYHNLLSASTRIKVISSSTLSSTLFSTAWNTAFTDTCDSTTCTRQKRFTALLNSAPKVLFLLRISLDIRIRVQYDAGDHLQHDEHHQHGEH